MRKYLIIFLYIFIFMFSTGSILYAETLNITSEPPIVSTSNILLPTPNNVDASAVTPSTLNTDSYEIAKIELVKYINSNPEIITVTINEELKVSQNSRIRFIFNNVLNKSNIPYVYLNNKLISQDKSMLEVSTSNAFEIVLNPILINQKNNIIRMENIDNFSELSFVFDATAPSLNISNPILNDYTVNKPNVSLEGTTDFDSKVNISGIPIDIDSFGNFSKTITLNTGKNILKIESIDICGNTSSIMKIINYEPQFPVLKFITPSQNAWIKPNDPFIFEISVEDEQNDIGEDALPYITVNNNKIENPDLINYDPDSKKISGIYMPENSNTSGLFDFTISIPDKMGHIGKTSIILNIDNLPPNFSYISFDGKTKSVETYSKQNQKLFYNELPVHNFYAYLEDEDSGLDLENSSFYLQNERNEGITLNITTKESRNDSSSYLELNTSEDLVNGVYKLFLLARDNVGNISSPSTNIIIVIGKDTLDSIMTSAISVFDISKALNYPNPCASTGTNISFYSTVSPVDVNISIYSIAGQLIRNIELGSTASAADGFISTFWNLTDDWGQIVPNGVYIYKIQATDNQNTKTLKGKIGVLK